jgi:hypothetical protein
LKHWIAKDIMNKASVSNTNKSFLFLYKLARVCPNLLVEAYSVGGLPSSLNSDKHYIFIRHRPRLLVLLRCGAGESSYSHVQSKILPADPISIQISRQVLGLYCFVALDNGDIYLFEVKTTKDEVGQSCGMSSTTRSELQLLLRFKMEIPHSRNFQLCLSSLLFSGDFIDARVLVVDSRVKIRLITSEESSKVCIALLQKEKGLQATQSFFISWNTNRLSLPLFEAMFGKQLHIWNDDTVIILSGFEDGSLQWVVVDTHLQKIVLQYSHLLWLNPSEQRTNETISHIIPVFYRCAKAVPSTTNDIVAIVLLGVHGTLKTIFAPANNRSTSAVCGICAAVLGGKLQDVKKINSACVIGEILVYLVDHTLHAINIFSKFGMEYDLCGLPMISLQKPVKILQMNSNYLVIINADGKISRCNLNNLLVPKIDIMEDFQTEQYKAHSTFNPERKRLSLPEGGVELQQLVENLQCSWLSESAQTDGIFVSFVSSKSGKAKVPIISTFSIKIKEKTVGMAQLSKQSFWVLIARIHIGKFGVVDEVKYYTVGLQELPVVNTAIDGNSCISWVINANFVAVEPIKIDVFLSAHNRYYECVTLQGRMFVHLSSSLFDLLDCCCMNHQSANKKSSSVRVAEEQRSSFEKQQHCQPLKIMFLHTGTLNSLLLNTQLKKLFPEKYNYKRVKTAMKFPIGWEYSSLHMGNIQKNICTFETPRFHNGEAKLVVHLYRNVYENFQTTRKEMYANLSQMSIFADSPATLSLVRAALYFRVCLTACYLGRLKGTDIDDNRSALLEELAHIQSMFCSAGSLIGYCLNGITTMRFPCCNQVQILNVANAVKCLYNQWHYCVNKF